MSLYPLAISEVTYSKEFYYLDVEKPFGVGAGNKLPWVDLSFVSRILPEHAWSAFLNCGHDDSLILFPGEYREHNFTEATVYTYKLSLQQWNRFTPTKPPIDIYHSQPQTVCDAKTETMYRFGGIKPPLTTNKYLDILDTSTLVWKNGSTVYAPGGRFDHTSTLLPNGNIVYIGGSLPDGKGFVEMSDNTTGDLPTRHACHSAVLTQDGRIIVYGGLTEDGGPAKDDLVILDTSQAVYTWSKANVSTNKPLPQFILPNEVFILDTSDKSNYKWVSEFIPPTPPTTPVQNFSTQNRNLEKKTIKTRYVCTLSTDKLNLESRRKDRHPMLLQIMKSSLEHTQPYQHQQQQQQLVDLIRIYKSKCIIKKYDTYGYEEFECI
ncbi:hypothetical protein GLOIN_2v1781367 [Rhizophagus irregularis DAOM 181602=DAOM 197198]|uniref:Galactose oxidase n=1 Tax=Rhizophagus irregularis (strain DAOM 181602 / DAOM 197198 / MUCL 43194) TaxID=747089 RepID=A0A2P4PKA8_RHIID|nr:hypothetical protein GLOIN_2v1781367 [Rhizophagus irregularis DAOM 181602=DAOM 197198]POG65798.1 hypothetical protein GLOIN_2v1781367 [Rhizophagus irregularis DAOM 181602=DAOM 197198]|eukprot:XP_025172664.1 hypothetical protein GLOIN_2v1781367 [Rhizophagus irregularis DAOM 181602=DAOM 197198]